MQEIVDAADYNVEVTIDNPNYAVVTANVTITVSRATLVIDIDDKEINYLEDLLQLTYDLHPQINEGADADRIALAYQSALDAIAQAQGKAVCDYAAGTISANTQYTLKRFWTTILLALTKGF